jgi:type I restriction enzyme S subunit
MRNISQAAIKAIRIPLAPEEVRNRILSCVEGAFTAISSTLRETERAAALIDRLNQATLAKEFRGELVEPQQTVEKELVISQ